MENEKIVKPTILREKTVKLVEPVTWGDEIIREIKLQAPRGKHLKMLPAQPNLGDILKIASKVSGLSSSIFDELCSTDVIAISEAMGELL